MVQFIYTNKTYRLKRTSTRQSFIVSKHTPRRTHFAGGSSVRRSTAKMKLGSVRLGLL